MAFYDRFETCSGYRVIYLEPMNAYFDRAAVPLSDAQVDQMLEAFAAYQCKEHARPTDTSTTLSMDWNGTVT